ncbi:MAG: DUF4278 domain-containing protein [Oscillatoriales cyanobacterium RM1_1_9]|nr:DUF4278 domain-containing protein [Oscillatoriales cyanobacterium SM2_3_0]NJO47437.1 DUF4278 domain-containing protein [Oscillatoriales cyanobacterium RM2_1_1]NJO70926.1 DUF4278 domain-containing protein [Oscillatoriales cyanobacterium RM1_1_9]
MDFKYRGINYTADFSPMDLVEGELGGRYRGQQWHVRYPRHMRVSQAYCTLQYRGVSYQGAVPALQASNNVVALNGSSYLPTETLAVSMNEDEDYSLIHRANLCRSLEYRWQIAQTKGDQQLIKALEREAQQLTCPIF